MLIILISWCYIFITLLNFGFLATSILKTSKPNKLLNLGLGLSSVLILGHVWAFFDGFDSVFHLVLLVLNFSLGIFFRHDISRYLGESFKAIIELAPSLKTLLGVLFLLILAKSASLGAVLDNENYYIQTIKWLNEYGFVKGVGNLHLFFGQTSGWHVLQSVFSFHFLDIELNDLGGFLLLMLNLYAVKELKSQDFSLICGLPVLNFLVLEFAIVPSPDFGIVLFSILIVFHFFKSFAQPKQEDVMLLLLFFLSAMLIKITAFGLIVFPMVLLLKLKNLSIQFYSKLLLVAIGFSLLWIGKNIIITGYPLFPSEAFSGVFSLNHQIPENLYNYSLRKDKLFEFFVSVQDLNSMSKTELFWKWLTHSKLGIIFNLIILSLLVFVPILITKSKTQKRYWWIYASFVIQILFLALTSPQYRFMLHYIVIFVLLLFGVLFKNYKLKLSVLFLSQAITLWFIVFPVRYNALTSKNYQLESVGFQLKNILRPAPNSSILSEYETIKMGNLKYHSPKEEVYFWNTGDGKLPCVNETQLNYLMTQTGFRPQLRDSTDLSKGFYAEKVEE